MLHLAQSSGGGTPIGSCRQWVLQGVPIFPTEETRLGIYHRFRSCCFAIGCKAFLSGFLWARVFGHRAFGKSLIGARGLRRRPTGQGRVRCGPHKAPITLQASMPYPPEIEASIVGLVMPKARRRSHRGLICRSHIPDISKNSQAFMGVSKHSPHCKDP